MISANRGWDSESRPRPDKAGMGTGTGMGRCALSALENGPGMIDLPRVPSPGPGSGPRGRGAVELQLVFNFIVGNLKADRTDLEGPRKSLRFLQSTFNRSDLSKRHTETGHGQAPGAGKRLQVTRLCAQLQWDLTSPAT